MKTVGTITRQHPALQPDDWECKLKTDARFVLPLPTVFAKRSQRVRPNRLDLLVGGVRGLHLDWHDHRHTIVLRTVHKTFAIDAAVEQATQIAAILYAEFTPASAQLSALEDQIHQLGSYAAIIQTNNGPIYADICYTEPFSGGRISYHPIRLETEQHGHGLAVIRVSDIKSIEQSHITVESLYQ